MLPGAETPKNEKKTIKKSIMFSKKSIMFPSTFEAIWDSFWLPKWFPKHPKNKEKQQKTLQNASFSQIEKST